MSGGADLPQDRDEILSLRRGHLRYFPVVPGRIEFCRRAAPGAAGRASGRGGGGAARVAEAAVYGGSGPSAGDVGGDVSGGGGSDRGVYIVVEPGDPFVEALRTAREIYAEVLWNPTPLTGPICRICIPIPTRCTPSRMAPSWRPTGSIRSRATTRWPIMPGHGVAPARH